MIMIKIQGKGTACKPDQYIIAKWISNKINYKNHKFWATQFQGDKILNT